MTFFFQLFVTGLALGMMYALIAIGFVIIFKCSQAFNIAQGQIVMLGAYFGYTFLMPLRLPVWIAIIASIGVGVVMGLVIERLALRPLLGQPALAIVMMTIALAGVMDGIAIMGWGGNYVTYHDVLPELTLKLGAVSVPPSSLLGLIVSVIVVAILMFIFRYTKIGLAMRATAEDEQVTRSLGIKATMVYALVWVIACVVGVVGGVLLGGVSGVSPPLSEIGLKALAVVILGGLDSIGGAILAGVMLGILENLAAGYLDPLMPSGGGLAGVFPFIIMLAVLILKPHGLFGLKRIERV
ncbi:MAG: branched-chain amino acid ABC transporter permease [Actinobacteria bacterium]|jgi:branched-chain amino acid transport system permease protein|nr:branched-chain amino acid ABC transporter permease [Actinomycetota bacterium]